MCIYLTGLRTIATAGVISSLIAAFGTDLPWHVIWLPDPDLECSCVFTVPPLKQAGQEHAENWRNYSKRSEMEGTCCWLKLLSASLLFTRGCQSKYLRMLDLVIDYDFLGKCVNPNMMSSPRVRPETMTHVNTHVSSWRALLEFCRSGR